MYNILRKWWWLIALRGAFVMIFGIVAIFANNIVLYEIAHYFGIFMILGGLSLVWSGLSTRKFFLNWRLWVIEGAIDILFAILVFTIASLPLNVVILFIAFWALTMGVIQIIDAHRIKTHTGIRSANGFIMLILGVFILFYPLLGKVIISTIIGSFAMCFGILNIVLSFKIKDIGEPYPYI